MLFKSVTICQLSETLLLSFAGCFVHDAIIDGKNSVANISHVAKHQLAMDQHARRAAHYSEISRRLTWGVHPRLQLLQGWSWLCRCQGLPQSGGCQSPQLCWSPALSYSADTNGQQLQELSSRYVSIMIQ